ncbi:hypothetical protein IID22_04660, partial [Patescibacteria group bacterium]|nr:hypothetical protein [Patescibacteria group bacterium]
MVKMRAAPDDNSVVGLTIRALKSIPGDEDPKIKINLNLKATEEGQGMYLGDFELSREGGVYGFVLPSEFLYHHGKNKNPFHTGLKTLKEATREGLWIVNSGVNLQALFENYD